MTSSLVGSEMCIRDRLKEKKMSMKRTLTIQRLSKKQKKNMSSMIHHINGCLLYTSDAADDM
eukprot:4036237-Prorocentrum_lima.AAC.1